MTAPGSEYPMGGSINPQTRSCFLGTKTIKGAQHKFHTTISNQKAPLVDIQRFCTSTHTKIHHKQQPQLCLNDGSSSPHDLFSQKLGHKISKRTPTKRKKSPALSRRNSQFTVPTSEDGHERVPVPSIELDLAPPVLPVHRAPNRPSRARHLVSRVLCVRNMP